MYSLTTFTLSSGWHFSELWSCSGMYKGGRSGQQGKQGRALGGRGEKSGKRPTSRRPGGGAGGRRGVKKIDPKDLPDLKALPGTGFDCDEKNPRLASCQ